MWNPEVRRPPGPDPDGVEYFRTRRPTVSNPESIGCLETSSRSLRFHFLGILFDRRSFAEVLARRRSSAFFYSVFLVVLPRRV